MLDYATLELVEKYRCRWGGSKGSESGEVAVSDVFLSKVLPSGVKALVCRYYERSRNFYHQDHGNQW